MATQRSSFLTSLTKVVRVTLQYRNLKLYLDLFLRLKKIHPAFSFRQSASMAPYIKFNIRHWCSESNHFESNLYKLLNNSTFGKRIENVKRIRVVKLMTQPSQLERLASKPTFCSCYIIHISLQSCTWLHSWSVSISQFMGVLYVYHSRTVQAQNVRPLL